MTSNKDDWETPQELFNQLNDIYHFTLDPCANEINHKCENYYDVEKDGLSQQWSGNVFCNPPYGRNMKAWIKKASEEAKNCDVIVLLIPARTDTSYFHDYIYKKKNVSIEFLRGRLKFEDKGIAKNPCPFPSMIVVMKGDERK